MSSTRGPAAAAGCGCAQSNVPRFSSFCRSRSIFRSAPRASPVRGETSSATAGRGGTPGCFYRRRWCCRGHAEAGSRRRRVRRPSARLEALGRWVIFYCSFPCQRLSGFFPGAPARHRWAPEVSLTCRHPATTTRSLPQTERRKIDHARSGRMVSSRPSAKPLI